MTLSPTEAAVYIVRNCRDRDRQEIECYSDIETMTMVAAAMYETANFSRIFYWRDRPVAFVMMHAVTPSCLSASMLATDDWRRVAGAVMRWGLGNFRKNAIGQGFRRLECRAMSGHNDAVNFLLRMGFVLECQVRDFGRNGEIFLQFAWRLSDHVFVTKDPQAG